MPLPKVSNTVIEVISYAFIKCKQRITGQVILKEHLGNYADGILLASVTRVISHFKELKVPPLILVPM